LGLALAYQLASALLGTLTVKSSRRNAYQPGFTEFNLKIPIQSSVQLENSELSDSVSQNVVNLERLSIFAADDHWVNRKVLQTILSNLEIKKVEIFEDGDVLVDRFQRLGSTEIPHIVLLDIQMPRMNGFEVVSSLKNLDCVSPHFPCFVAVTAQVDEEAAILSSGFDFVIRKPFTPNELKQALQSICREHRNSFV
jgi:CheY-like chemotaxis protein